MTGARKTCENKAMNTREVFHVSIEDDGFRGARTTWHSRELLHKYVDDILDIIVDDSDHFDIVIEVDRIPSE